MSADRAPAAVIWSLGVTQIAGYGTLFYSFAILAPSISAALGWPQQWIFAALSLSLIAGSLVAPTAGRLADRHGAGRVMTWGSLAASAALGLAAAAPNAYAFVAALFAMQVAASFVLYSTAFVAIVQVGGGPAVKQPIGQLLTANVIGHKPYDPYPTPESKGDPEKAKQLLAEAGFPNGIELKYSYAAGGRYDLYSAALQAGLDKAGIKLIMQPGPSRTVMSQMYQNRQATNAGAWDLGMTSLRADWVGDSARTMIVPMFHGEACEKSTSNWSCYNNPEVNALIDKALTATDETVAADAWAEADRAIMADAPVVPLITGKISLYASERMRGTTVNLLFNNVDPTLVWIDE